MENVLKTGMPILTSTDDSVRAGSESWQAHLKMAVRSLDQLLQRVGLDPDGPELEQAGLAGQDFPVFVPIPWLNRIRPGDPNDPLLAQVLATAAERTTVPGFVKDPLDESEFQPIPGVLHKYQGRVLLVVAGVCAINCRYCFRRHFPYDSAPRSREQLAEAFGYLRDHPEVDEVLLSGGDPLMLSDERLEWIVGQLDLIPTLRRLRIHTRMPVAIPQRVTNRLTEILRSSRLKTVVVIHANHPAEIDADVASALRAMRDGADAMMLNQSVLLRGVNDSVEVLEGLSRRLFECGVLPYYLHQLDPVAGAAHFEVPLQTGQTLMATLRDRLPGYMVPTWVQEIPGQKSKTPLA